MAEEMSSKRKRADRPLKSRKVARKQSSSEDESSIQDEILQIEAEVAESTSPGSGIDKLLKIFDVRSGRSEVTLATAVALCRIFYRWIATNHLGSRKDLSVEDRDQIYWTKRKLDEYTTGLCRLLCSEDPQIRSTSLTLLMRLVKAETSTTEARSVQAWKHGIFPSLIVALIDPECSHEVREEFRDAFLEEHDDVRFHSFAAVVRILSDNKHDARHALRLASGTVDLLLGIEGIPESKDQLQDWYGHAPETASHSLLSLSAHKKSAQEAWLAVFQCKLTKPQRKQILGSLTERIAPWFNKPEVLMDFLTDSYNESGATALLALEGIFYLIKERNLDYPQFYDKLYSLLDDGILHSKHRADFFRLLEVFLSSTHLPAALVASFIKRLSRLALNAPPGGIVMVVPWIYNTLKMHPQCTLMIHREIRTPQVKADLESSGMDDPFDMHEGDPLSTGAVESCLWELHSLQHHYQPNVATLAKIIEEQFTKQEYHLDDFLDHTYDGLIEAELGKPMKRSPVVEFEIPKRILTREDGGLSNAGSMLQQALLVSG